MIAIRTQTCIYIQAYRGGHKRVLADGRGPCPLRISSLVIANGGYIYTQNLVFFSNLANDNTSATAHYTRNTPLHIMDTE